MKTKTISQSDIVVRKHLPSYLVVTRVFKNKKLYSRKNRNSFED